jgi:hypothetical protein
VSAERTERRPGWVTYLRDTLLFLAGLAIVFKQAGIGFDPPDGGPEIELIILGGLFCNGPVVLQALAIRTGSGGSPSSTPPPGPPSPPELSSAPSSGGE